MFTVEQGELVLEHSQALQNAELNITQAGDVNTNGMSHQFRALTAVESQYRFGPNAHGERQCRPQLRRGVSSGAGSSIKNGSNYWTLEGASSHTGITHINEGKLYLAHPNALQNSIVSNNVNDGLRLNQSATLGG